MVAHPYRPSNQLSKPREFELCDRDFARLTQLAKQLAGVSLGRGKLELVYTRLARRLRRLGLNSFTHYCDLVAQPGNAEAEHFIDALTTHVTVFFRENHHFEFLEQKIWPQLAEAKPSPRIWSAGCSTGEEVYSLAMSFGDATRNQVKFEVVGTDVSAASIASANSGIYDRSQLRGVSAQRLRHYFQKGVAKRAGQYRAKPPLTNGTHFSVESLMSISNASRPYDVIMCRNVLIYFSRNVAGAICTGLVRQLAPGGHLVLGHSEGGTPLPSTMNQVAPTVYRREL